MNDTTKIALQDLFDAIEGLDTEWYKPWYKRRKRVVRGWHECVVANSMALQDEIIQELNDGLH